MNNIKPYISFTSNIKFCTLYDYIDAPITRSKQYVSPVGKIEHTVIGKEAYTDSIEICTAGGVTNTENSKMMMFHLCPTDKNLSKIEEIKQYLSEKIKEVSPDCKNGIIVGGRTSSEIKQTTEEPQKTMPKPSLFRKIISIVFADLEEANNNHIEIKEKPLPTKTSSEASKELFEHLKSFFTKDKKIDISVFWGQKQGYSDMYYNVEDDTWKIFKPNNSGQNAIKSVEDLKREYQEIHLAESDKLYIENKEISREDLKSD
ncbi:MAG: hypothetical protein WCK67_00650 [bacterium]